MSAADVSARLLQRLNSPQAVLAPDRSGVGFAIYPAGDRRRRPSGKLTALQVKALAASGAIAALDEKNTFVLTEAGRARLRRDAALPGEAFLAQHRAVETRSVIDAEGDVRAVRGLDPTGGLKRLASLRDARGGPFLSPAETSAALRLRADYEAGQAGLVRGSDWSAPPRGSAPRVGNAQEAAMNAGCDARRRVAACLDGLAPQLRRVVERVCLADEGLEALERSESWPARSGKIALKLGLAQLAAVQAQVR